MKKIKLVLIAIILVAGFVTISCEQDNINESFGKLTLKLSDAPLDYAQFKEANITIDKIEIRKKGGKYISLMNHPKKSNLLELVNGITETLVDMELPEGDYDLIRLYMSSSEMIMANGNTYADEMNFGSYSGDHMMGNGMMMNDEMNSIDIPFETMLTIMEGIHEEFLLDVDVSQSFMLEGIEYTNMGYGMMMNISGFSFYPMMRFVHMSTTGTIKGTVQGEDGFLANATVTLMHNGEEYTSTHTGDNGNYTLIGIPEGGSYSINVELDGYMMNNLQNGTIPGSFDMMSGSMLLMNFYMKTTD